MNRQASHCVGLWGPAACVFLFIVLCGGDRYIAVSATDAMGSPAESRPEAARGPLTVHPNNPRYFTDGTGRAIYLAGSHHWNNFLDSGEAHQPIKTFDFDRYLSLLSSFGHNFIRLWAWEGGVNKNYVDLFPYARTGPGVALDGKLRFDLDRFDRAYFDRLRSRVVAAQARGIYVSVMLFNGWSLYDHGFGNPWSRHPFNAANNVNGVNGDPDGDGEGKDLQSRPTPAVLARQEAYIRQVVDAVNDLDNVLYEISNESDLLSKDWQYRMIRFVHDYERTKPKQHPVGMTAFDTNPEEADRSRAMEVLLASPAEWISPCNDRTANYATAPPATTGRKVVLADTDHFFPVGGDHSWVWKTFLRGLNPVYMDPLDQITGLSQDPVGAETARKAMGHTRSYARKMNLAAMKPDSAVCSTGYCLAGHGSEYVVYLPFGAHWFEPWVAQFPLRVQRWIKSLNLFHRTVTVDLSAVSRPVAVEWFDPVKGITLPGGTSEGGKPQHFTAPFRGDAVLYLRASS